MNAPREFRTHRPSGLPSWPLILLAGAEKTGKSWEAATFSGSDLIGRTLWIQLGEATAEEYGAVPGADYEVVEHDGSYRDLIDAAEWAVRQPRTDGKPNMVVIDSVTVLWDMLSAEQQEIALRRRKPGANGEAKVTMDQWNAAKDRWNRFLEIVGRNDGPVLLLARMELVTLVDEGGQPTKNKDWKIKTEKNLPYAVSVIVSLPTLGEAWLSGIQSTRLLLEKGEKRRLEDFSLDRLMRAMGLAQEGATAPRQHTASRPDADEAMADAGPQRPATRQPRQGPVEDEWSTTRPPSAEPDVVRHVLAGVRQVRGLTEDAAVRTAIETIVSREVSDPFTLTADECATIAAVLEQDARRGGPPADGGKPAAPERTPDGTAQQRGLIAQLCAELDVHDREARLRLVSSILPDKRAIASTNDLYKTEASAVINELSARADAYRQAITDQNTPQEVPA